MPTLRKNGAIGDTDMTSRKLSEFKTQHDPATIIARLEGELKAATKQLGLENAVKEILGTSLLGLDKINPPAWTQKITKSGSPGVPTLFLSDLHWGERVFPSQVNGVNEFDLSIAHARMEHTINTAIYLLRILGQGKMDYPGIVVPLGGDMISGDIHEELATTNELATMPTLLDLYETLIAALKTLADQFGSVFVPCVSGNHGRNTKKIFAKNRNHTSFDWLLYQM